ncbi:MAG TPA: aldo/keto reductase [Oscillospiraceae bacterium]|nr:aldo/keto reductase [Oscillospiraceae bacterium]
MKKINYSGTNDKISCACLGTMMMGTLINKADSYSILDDFLANGGNFVDTANCYSWWFDKASVGDDSENLIGDWMSERKNRSEIFLATKFGARLMHPDKIRDKNGEVKWNEVRGDYEGCSAKTIKAAVEGSLKRLKTDYIDLYYVHVDDRTVPLEETLSALSDLVKEGKVKNIGCSNMRTWRLSNAREISKQKGLPLFSTIQQEYSYIRPNIGVDRGIDISADDELFDYIKSNPDMMLVAYSPLLKGIYTSEEKRKNYYDWGSFNNGESLERIKLIDKMSKEMGISGNKLVLSWILHKKPEIIPILGFSKIEQYKENMEALDIKLTDEQMKILNNGKLL